MLIVHDQHIAVDQSLLDQLALERGAEVRIGQADYVIGAVLEREPDSLRRELGTGAGEVARIVSEVKQAGYQLEVKIDGAAVSLTPRRG